MIMGKILFIIGLVFLCINMVRFLIGNYAVLKSNLHWASKVWNLIESIGICIIVTLLILKYYE